MVTKRKTGLEIGATDKASPKVRKLGKSFDFLAKKSKKLNAQFAKTSAIKNQLSGFKKLGNKISGVGKSMTLGLTVPIGLAGASIIRASANFEKGMNKVEALTGATGKALVSMRDKAKDLGSTTSFSASEAADAMSFLGMAGQNTKEIMSSIGPVLDLAAASGIGLADAANIATNIMGPFGIAAKDAVRVSNVLAAVTSKSNVNMQQLADTMKFAAPVANEFGLSLEDTAAAAGLLGNVGIQGTAAGTALKNAFLGLSAPGSRARQIMKDLKVEVVDGNKDMLRFSDIMGNMAGALQKLPQQKRLAVLKEVFGKIGIAGAASLARVAKTGKLGELQDALKNVDGFAKKMSQTMLKGLPGALVSFTSALEGAQIALGESGMGKAFTFLLNKVSKFLRWLAKGDSSMLQTITIVGGVVAAIGPLALIIGTMISLGPVFVAGLGAMGTAFFFVAGAAGTMLSVLGTIGAFLLANPIGIAITAIAAGAFLIIKYWEPIKTFFKDLWAGIKSNFARGVNFITSKLAGIPLLGNLFGPDQGSAGKAGSFGPERSTSKSNEAIKSTSSTQTNNASVDVNIGGLPQGSTVNNSGGDFLDLSLGFANV